MHNPESVLANEMHTLLCNFKIQTGHLVSARTPDLRIINKKENLQNCGLCCPHSEIDKKCEKRDKYLDFARELNKTIEHEGDNYTNLDWRFWYSFQSLLEGLEDLEIRERVETIQTTTLLGTARILRRVLETWRDLLLLKLQWKPIS